MITLTYNKKKKVKGELKLVVEIMCFVNMDKAKAFAAPIAEKMKAAEAQRARGLNVEPDEYITDMSYDTQSEGLILAELGLIGQDEAPENKVHAVHII